MLRKSLSSAIQGRGWKQRVGDNFTLAIQRSFVGWFGLLPVGADPWIVTPTLGVHYKELEDLLMDFLMGARHPWRPATLRAPLGQISHWPHDSVIDLREKWNVNTIVTELVEAVDSSGLDTVRSWCSGERILAELTSPGLPFVPEPQLFWRAYRAPLLLLILGHTAEGLRELMVRGAELEKQYPSNYGTYRSFSTRVVEFINRVESE